MCFFQDFRGKNGDLLSGLALFLHFLCDSLILYTCYIGSKLLHVAFQNVLVHFICQVVLPVKFRKILHRYCQNLLQRCFSGKIRIHQFIVKPVNEADQLHSIGDGGSIGNKVQIIVDPARGFQGRNQIGGCSCIWRSCRLR